MHVAFLVYRSNFFAADCIEVKYKSHSNVKRERGNRVGNRTDSFYLDEWLQLGRQIIASWTSVAAQN